MKNETFTAEQFTKFVKDMSAAVKRVYNTPGIVDEMTVEQRNDFKARVEKYTPSNPEGQGRKSTVLYTLETTVAVEAASTNGSVATPVNDMSAEVAKRIAEESIVIEIHIRQPGFTKKIDANDFLDRNGNKGKVESDILHVHQDLIDKRHVKNLMDHRQSLLDYIRSWQVPGGMLTPGGGQFLVPLAAQEKIYAKIEEFGAERQGLLDKFAESWDTIVEEAKKKRGVFFDDGDYPSFKSIRDRFTHDFRFISNKVPDELKKLGLEIYQKEFDKQMLNCATAASEIQAALREGFLGLIEHFTDRLGVDEETGKPKRFNEKRITDIREFLETFQARNLTNDTQLAALCEKAQTLIEGVDAATIRSNADARASLKQAFDDLTTATNELIGTKTRRVRVAAASNGQ
jgi:hypothetical protein